MWTTLQLLLSRELGRLKKYLLFLPAQYGLVAEWLGTGLQNRALRFESGRDLRKSATHVALFYFPLYITYVFAE